jgi:hypothetical protein
MLADIMDHFSENLQPVASFKLTCFISYSQLMTKAINTDRKQDSREGTDN